MSGPICAFCGKPSEDEYAVHRDGFGVGPVVPLCNACGSGEEPTLDEIWARIAQPTAGDDSAYRPIGKGGAR